MKFRILFALAAVTVALPQGLALANSTGGGETGATDGAKFSTSSSDLINQNQNSVTNNDTTQAATGVVQQSATYNVGQASTYDFRGISGTRVYCPKPSVLLSGGSNFSSYGQTSGQVSAALVLPLGGKLGKNCTTISNQIVKEQEQYLLHTSFNHQYEMASRCASLKKTGANINAEIFPELAAMCDGISLSPPIGGAEPPQSTPVKVTVPPPPPAVRSSH